MIRKDIAPSETVRSIKNILNENEIEVIEKSFNCSAGGVYSINIYLKDFPGTFSNGKGKTKEAALASAYAEMMERLQTRMNFSKYFSIKSAFEKNFVNTDKSILEENIYFPAELEKFKSLNVAKEGEIFIDLLTGKQKILPIRIINSVCGSNGLCAGNSREEAIVQGICEIFERHVWKNIFLGVNNIFIIDMNIVFEKFHKIKDTVTDIENCGFICKIYDCSLGKFPVLGAMVIDKEDKTYRLALGSDPEFEIAFERCVSELFQGNSVFSNKDFEAISLPINVQNNFFKAETFTAESKAYKNFLDCFLSNNGLVPIELFYAKEVHYISNIFSNPKNNSEALNIVKKILSENNLTAYLKDYTSLGFPTFRVYIPSLSEIIIQNTQELSLIKGDKGIFKIIYQLINMKEISVEQLTSLSRNLEILAEQKANRIKPIANEILKIAIKEDKIDFDFIYLDFLIFMIHFHLKNYKEAYHYLDRFIAENNVLRNDDSGLYSGILLYTLELSKGKQLDQIYEQVKKILSVKTNDYLKTMISNKSILDIIRYPSCPDCVKCMYEEKCLYSLWKEIDNKLVKSL